MTGDAGIRLKSAGDYSRALDALKPQGLAWPRGLDSLQVQLIAALAVEFSRVDASIYQVAQDIWPGATGSFVPDWERASGLPDPCAEPPDPNDFATRRDLILARITARGGASPAFFEAFGLALGWDVEVERCNVPVCGLASCGVSQLFPDRVGDPGPVGSDPTSANSAYPFWWKATVKTPVGGVFAECGVSELGLSSLGRFDISRLQCAFEAVKPAHTRIAWIIEENT